MKKLVFIYFMFLSFSSILKAQEILYEEKIELSNNMFKVKSGNSYGIVDSKGHVVVSVEYDDILFREDYALLTKKGMLKGILKKDGVIKPVQGDFSIHPYYKYVYEGYVIVKNENSWLKPKWGYIDVNGNPLKIKVKGGKTIGKTSPTQFMDVTPFVDGFASVLINKKGWKHLDKGGRERFILKDKKEIAYYRTAPYRGECVIVSSKGIKLYEENGHNAVVKKVIEERNLPLSKNDDFSRILKFEGGCLLIDSLNRADVFKKGTDSIVFIPRPCAKVVNRTVSVHKKIDTISIENNIDVELVNKYVNANSKGLASFNVKIKNLSDSKFENLSVDIECSGKIKRWKGSLAPKAELNRTLNIPARFSARYVRHNVDITITYKDEEIRKSRLVTIKRYTPVRSR